MRLEAVAGGMPSAAALSLFLPRASATLPQCGAFRLRHDCGITQANEGVIHDRISSKLERGMVVRYVRHGSLRRPVQDVGPMQHPKLFDILVPSRESEESRQSPLRSLRAAVI